MEAQIRQKEEALKSAEKARKQIVLRLSPTLWNDLSAWAQEDFRSINGQIEYLLTEAVREKRKKDH
ncbi:MAG: Arc family DNA-binding protein [Clostridia bacterium]|nr:Arc family DNA-binding protein [Clostridia bacterium]